MRIEVHMHMHTQLQHRSVLLFCRTSVFAYHTKLYLIERDNAARIYEWQLVWHVHFVATSSACQHDVLGALHLILAFLRPWSRAPAAERIVFATCVLQARREALRGVARYRRFCDAVR